MRLSDFLLAIVALAIGLFALGIAYAFLPSLSEYLTLISTGQDWQLGELARYLGLVTGPTCLGLLVVSGAFTGIGYAGGIRARAMRTPDEPWLWRKDWAERRIQLSNRSAVYATVAIVGFYLALVVPMCVAMAEIKNASMTYSFLGLFTLIQLGFFRLLWMNRVWNRSELKLETLPGVIGGPFAGVVTIPELFPTDTPFRVTLRCHSTSKRSNRGPMDTQILWQDQQIISKCLAAGRTEIPVRFAIPFDCEPTGSEILGGPTWIAPTAKVREHISWTLSVMLKREGDTREAKFEVPVFKTEASSPQYKEEPTLIEPYLEPVDTAAVLARFPFSSKSLPDGGTLLRFSLFRADVVLFLVGLTAGSAAALWALVVNVGSWPVVFILGMMPVALMVIGITSLYELLLWKSAVAIHADRVEFLAGYLGRQTKVVWPRNKPIPLTTAEEFRKDNGAWWSVLVAVPNGNPLRVIKRLDGKQEAAAAQKWLAEQLVRSR